MYTNQIAFGPTSLPRLEVNFRSVVKTIYPRPIKISAENTMSLDWETLNIYKIDE